MYLGSIHDLFKVTVNGVNCTCFLEIYRQKHNHYTEKKKERDLHTRPYMFFTPQKYQDGRDALNKQVSALSSELENLERNFNSIITQMLQAVDCLHSKNLVHRDLKRKYSYKHEKP